MGSFHHHIVCHGLGAIATNICLALFWREEISVLKETRSSRNILEEKRWSMITIGATLRLSECVAVLLAALRFDLGPVPVVLLER